MAKLSIRSIRGSRVDVTLLTLAPQALTAHLAGLKSIQPKNFSLGAGCSLEFVGTKIEHEHFCSQTFWAPPGHPGKNPGDIPSKSLVSLGCEGHTELFGPHPSTRNTPTPSEDVRTKTFGFGFPFFSPRKFGGPAERTKFVFFGGRSLPLSGRQGEEKLRVFDTFPGIFRLFRRLFRESDSSQSRKSGRLFPDVGII